LASVADDTTIDLRIDFEKLFWNMHDAKAEWLYKLDSWQNVISEDRRTEIAKEYRESQIVRVEKIGRNDPCPCGSGKKYKQCCMKKQEART
jgi:preprotein translocase subunit SecA